MIAVGRRFFRILGGFLLLAAAVWPDARAARTPDEPSEPETLAVRDGPYVGRFLVATPKMADPRFAKTVILMLEHRVGALNGGAMGLVINRQIGTGPLGKLLEGSDMALDENLADFEVTLYYGGPVEGYLAFILHSDDYQGGPGARPIRGMANGRAVLSTDAGILKEIVQGQGPRHSLVILGYAGWGPGQLEREIDEGAWVVVPADADLVFGPDRGEALWRKTWDLREVDL